MSGGRHDLEFRRHEDWALVVTVRTAGVPVDVSSWTWASQVRRTPTSALVLVSLLVDTSDSASGRVVLSLSSEAAADLPLGEATWSLRRTLPGAITDTFLYGDVSIEESNTR